MTAYTGTPLPSDLPPNVRERYLVLARRRDALRRVEPMADEAARLTERLRDLLDLYSLDHRKAMTRRRRAQERKDTRARGLPPCDPRHGTLHGYTTFGCRCDDCTEARREYERGRASSSTENATRELPAASGQLQDALTAQADGPRE